MNLSSSTNDAAQNTAAVSFHGGGISRAANDNSIVVLALGAALLFVLLNKRGK